jgi:hypothetical protein
MAIICKINLSNYLKTKRVGGAVENWELGIENGELRIENGELRIEN